MTEEPLTDQAEAAPEPDPAGVEAGVAAEAVAEPTGGVGDDAAWSTGDARVDEAVGRLDELEARDLDEHADVYDTIHGDLADVLNDAGPHA